MTQKYEVPDYADIVVDELRDDVQMANNNIGKDLDAKRRTVDELFDKWITFNRGVEDYNKIAHDGEIFEKDFSGQLALIAVGLIGLVRVKHVDLNQQLKAATEDTEKQELVLRYQHLQEILSTNKVVNVTELIPQTIHGDPIFWEGEFAQDRASTYSILGESDRAIEELQNAVALAQQKTNEYGILSQPKLLAAIESSRAVAEIRLGREINDIQLLRSGLLRQQRSMKERKDERRMFDLSGMTLKYLQKQKEMLCTPVGLFTALQAYFLYRKYNPQ